MHRCIPEPSSRKKILEEAYLFFLAFFFAGILFSSHHSKISAERNGGARYQLQCIVSARSLVKKKVNDVGRELSFAGSGSLIFNDTHPRVEN
jgi:hypothetical protein